MTGGLKHTSLHTMFEQTTMINLDVLCDPQVIGTVTPGHSLTATQPAQKPAFVCVVKCVFGGLCIGIGCIVSKQHSFYLTTNFTLGAIQ